MAEFLQPESDGAIPAEFRDEYANNARAIDAIRKVFEEKKCDFRLKVQRRRSLSSPKKLEAVFNGVTFRQIEEMDMWLPNLIGTGIVDIIEVYDPNKPALPFAVLTMKAAESHPTPFQFAATKDANYQGPSDIMYPRPTDESLAAYGASPILVEATKAVMAQQQNQQIPSGVNVNIPASQDGSKAEREAVMRMREQLLEQKTQLEIDQTKREAELRLRAAQQEADRLRSENERVVAEMNRRLDQLTIQLSQKPVEQPKGPSLTELLPTLISAAAPIITALTTSSQQTQMAIMQQQAQIAQQNAEANRTLMTSLLTKKPIDDTILAIMNKPDNSAALLQSVTSAFGDTTRNMMQIMSMATEMMMNQTGGQEASIWPDILKSVVKAYVSTQANMASAVQKAQLPAPSNVVPLQQPPQQLEAAEPQPAGPKSALDAVRYLIIEKKETPSRVAHFILKQIDPNEKSDGSIVTALMAAKSIREFMLRTLGGWIDQAGSKEYVRELVIETVKLGGDRGLWDGEEFLARAMEELGDFGASAEESEEDQESEESEEEEETSEGEE